MAGGTSKRVVFPGERLFPENSHYEAGRGTYSTHGHIHSTLAGFLHLVPLEKEGLVESIQQRYCKCAIVCVEDSVLPHEFSGEIRKEDVRAAERDKVEMYKAYRPKDVILARVIALGDSKVSYQLSSAEDELGVVFCYCEDVSGHKMSRIPKDVRRMECTGCGGRREWRKVAAVPNIPAKTSS